MMKSKSNDRFDFLIKKFDILDDNEIIIRSKKLIDEDFTVKKIESKNGDILAIVYYPNVGKQKTNISISKYVFDMMVESDPALNKMYTQWMLEVFRRLLKKASMESVINTDSVQISEVGINTDSPNDKYAEAIRFVVEDLPMASEYLIIFESNKRKNKFKKLCSSSFILKDVTDPTDINQYKSLSQLFDAVDPFIERDSSKIERLLYRFVESGQAEIGVRDRKFTVYIPLTVDASVVFDSFANWCTCKSGNGMFKHYTTNYKTPKGRVSKIYVVINNEFFNGELNDNTLFQIHFESNQIKDRKNTMSNVGIYEHLSISENVLNFFHDELIELSKEYKNLSENLYLNNLIKFGFSDSLFEIIEETTPLIVFKNKEVPKMGDVSRFINLQTLEMNNTKLVNIHPSISSLNKLEIMVLRDNRITKLPKEIGNLKNLVFLNILGNKIVDIPDTIKYLDKSNGGNLYRVAVSSSDIGVENYEKLKRLLPNTILS